MKWWYLLLQHHHHAISRTPRPPQQKEKLPFWNPSKTDTKATQQQHAHHRTKLQRNQTRCFHALDATAWTPSSATTTTTTSTNRATSFFFFIYVHFISPFLIKLHYLNNLSFSNFPLFLTHSPFQHNNTLFLLQQQHTPSSFPLHASLFDLLL